MLQKIMIQRVREICLEDPAIEAAMMYGSFATGEDDRFSDIEFALFFSDECFSHVDQLAWIARIDTPVLYFPEDYGHHTAIFSNLVRGEFHFQPASKISMVEMWQGHGRFPSVESTIIVDRTGELEKHLRPLIGLPPQSNTNATLLPVASNFINLVLLGTNILARGEFARAWALLSEVHRNLLRLVRLSENNNEHRPTPARLLEKDIPVQLYERYRGCTADLDKFSLWIAYYETWKWGRELMSIAENRGDTALPITIIEALTRRIETEITEL